MSRNGNKGDRGWGLPTILKSVVNRTLYRRARLVSGSDEYRVEIYKYPTQLSLPLAQAICVSCDECVVHFLRLVVLWSERGD